MAFYGPRGGEAGGATGPGGKRHAWGELRERMAHLEGLLEGLREAITNAVMHRDWFFDGANVFVEIYTDRIEVSSPGSLPKGLTLADLGRKSVRRNALVSDS